MDKKSPKKQQYVCYSNSTYIGKIFSSESEKLIRDFKSRGGSMEHIRVITVPEMAEDKGVTKLITKQEAVKWVCSECGKELKRPIKVNIPTDHLVVRVDTWETPCGHVMPLKYFKKCTTEELIDFYYHFEAPMTLDMKSFNPLKATREEIIAYIDKKQNTKEAVKKAYQSEK